MVTIKDIAKQAGLSTASVSVALNNKPGVSEETRSYILELARKMNYITNASAKTLKTRRSHTIGLVVGDLSSSYFQDIISAAEEVARASDYQIFICNAGTDIENVIKSLRALRAKGVDGILFSFSMAINPAFVQEVESLIRSNIRVVSLNRCDIKPDIPIVSYDEDNAVREILDRLESLGHRHIGIICGPRDSRLTRYRLGLIESILSEKGIYDDRLVVYSQMHVENARQDAIRLLQAHPEISAIYGVNDDIALGVLLAAEELGISVPRQLSLVGGNGNPYVAYLKPQITTVVTPRQAIGRLAVQKIIDMIESRKSEISNRTLLPCVVSDGQSIAVNSRGG